MNDRELYFMFGARYNKIRDIYNMINEQLSGNIAKQINVDDINWFIDILLGCLIERNVESKEVLNFCYNSSVSIIKWVNIFGDEKFSDVMKKAKLINELTCDCLSVDNLVRISSILVSKIDNFMNKTRPVGIDMSRHYYNILHS